MRRRTVLALLGTGVAALAGCSTNASDDSSTPSSGTQRESATDTRTETTTGAATGTPTQTPTPDSNRRASMGESVTLNGADVTVTNPRVRQAVAGEMTATDETFVRAHEGQYVLVDVQTGSTTSPIEDLDLRSVVNGEQAPDGDPIVPLDGPPTLAFPFPTGRHDSVAIRSTTGDRPVVWRLPTSVRETLAREPRFRVDLTTRRRDEDGEFVLDLTVTNEGERDGYFVARVSFEAFTGGHIVQFPVPAGESRSYTDDSKILLYFEDNGGGTLTVQYPDADGLTKATLRESFPETPTPTE